MRAYVRVSYACANEQYANQHYLCICIYKYII